MSIQQIQKNPDMFLNNIIDENSNTFVGFAMDKTPENSKNIYSKSTKILGKESKVLNNINGKPVLKVKNFSTKVDIIRDPHKNDKSSISYIMLDIIVETQEYELLMTEILKANTMYIFKCTTDGAKKDTTKITTVRSFLNKFEFNLNEQDKYTILSFKFTSYNTTTLTETNTTESGGNISSTIVSSDNTANKVK